MNSAEETASRIFAQSGIELHWLPCGREEESVEEQRACIQTCFPEHLHVHIVNSNPHLNGSVFGISYFSADGIGSQADVFYTKIASFHGVSSVEPGTLLGHAMAHELGHLLLGSNSHSLTGLMCANWRTKDLIHMEQGGLLFSEEQSLKMKAKLSTFAMQKDTGLHAVPSGGELPFRTYRDYLIVVQGSLGGKLRRNLIIDTGTDPSVIDSRAAQELHMAGVVGKLAVHDQVVEVQQAVLPSVQIGTLRAESLPVLIRDLGFLQKDLGIRIDAVIGLDVLSLSNFCINYATKRIVFGVTPVSGSSVPFQGAPPWLTVRMEVDGVSIDLLLDTAASCILLFHSRIQDQLPQLISLGERKSSNMGGDFRLQRVLLATTNFGETDFGQQNAFVVEDQEDESREFDGLLGPSALGLKQIAFDFQRHTLSWKK